MTALEKFGLPNKATPEEVKSEWRRLAAIHHPDKGGDAAEFARIRVLFKAAFIEASEPDPCPQCLGTGKTMKTYGFNSINMTCSHCGGSGTI